MYKINTYINISANTPYCLVCRYNITNNQQNSDNHNNNNNILSPIQKPSMENLNNFSSNYDIYHSNEFTSSS